MMHACKNKHRQSDPGCSVYWCAGVNKHMSLCCRNGGLLWMYMTKLGLGRCGVLAVLLVRFFRESEPLRGSRVCVCVWWSIKVLVTLYKSSDCDRRLVHNVKRRPSLLKALQAQSSIWPQIIRRAPAASALHHCHDAHSLTSSGQSWTRSHKTEWDGREWQTHSFMLFPSFEIAIKADLI